MEQRNAELRSRRTSHTARAALVLLVVGLAVGWLLTGGSVTMEEWQARRIIKTWVAENVDDARKTEVLYISQPGTLMRDVYRYVKVRALNRRGDAVVEEVMLRYSDGRPVEAMSVMQFTARVHGLHPSPGELEAMTVALEEMANHPAALNEP